LSEQQRLSEVTSTLRETQTKISDLSTRALALEDTLARTDIRAPVAGEVVGLRVRTVGAVVGPGDPLLEIVPASGSLVVIARVNPIDIDSVRAGQSADIRFSAFDMRYTHVITGTVVKVSADAMQDPQSELQYYEAEVQVDAEGITQMREEGFNLVPGMPAEVLIKTGGLTLMRLLAEAFLAYACAGVPRAVSTPLP